jgi:hypothetical protein
MKTWSDERDVEVPDKEGISAGRQPLKHAELRDDIINQGNRLHALTMARNDLKIYKKAKRKKTGENGKKRTDIVTENGNAMTNIRGSCGSSRNWCFYSLEDAE